MPVQDAFKLTNQIGNYKNVNVFQDCFSAQTLLHTFYSFGVDNIINKCRPILVQGLRRDKEINFLSNNIYGSVAQLIECSAIVQKVPGSNLGMEEFFHLNSF